MHINIISETVLDPKQFGGMHTAFLNHIQLLKRTDVKISLNSWGRADITHIHTVGPFSLYKLLTSRNTVIYTHFLPETFVGSYKGGKFFAIFMKWYLRLFYNRAALVITFTKKIERELRRLGITTRIEVLPNPVNNEFFHKSAELREKGRKQYRIPSNTFVVLGVGNTILRKGVNEFIKLAHKFPKATFVWVGDKLEHLSVDTDVETEQTGNHPTNIIWTGYVPYTHMPVLYNTADLFLFPSHQETQGLVIIEAAATGLPVVIRDLPEYKELYDTNYIGCSTIEEFENAIHKLQTNDEFYKKYVTESKILAEKFSYSAIADRLLTYYRSLLHRE